MTVNSILHEGSTMLRFVYLSDLAVLIGDISRTQWLKTVPEDETADIGNVSITKDKGDSVIFGFRNG